MSPFCETFWWPRIRRTVSGAATPAVSRRVEQHLAHCDSCRDLYNRLTLAERALAGSVEQAPVELSDAEVEAMEQALGLGEQAANQPMGRRALPAAAAAVLALGIGFGVGIDRVVTTGATPGVPVVDQELRPRGHVSPAVRGDLPHGVRVFCAGLAADGATRVTALPTTGGAAVRCVRGSVLTFEHSGGSRVAPPPERLFGYTADGRLVSPRVDAASVDGDPILSDVVSLDEQVPIGRLDLMALYAADDTHGPRVVYIASVEVTE